MGLVWLSWSCGCGGGIVEGTWEGAEEDFDPANEVRENYDAEDARGGAGFEKRKFLFNRTL